MNRQEESLTETSLTGFRQIPCERTEEAEKRTITRPHFVPNRRDTSSSSDPESDNEEESLLSEGEVPVSSVQVPFTTALNNKGSDRLRQDTEEVFYLIRVYFHEIHEDVPFVDCRGPRSKTGKCRRQSLCQRRAQKLYFPNVDVFFRFSEFQL